MIRKLFAMWLGNRVDRSDGRGGVKGAALGFMVERATRGRLGPFGWVLLGIAALWKLLSGRRNRTYR